MSDFNFFKSSPVVVETPAEVAVVELSPEQAARRDAFNTWGVTR